MPNDIIPLWKHRGCGGAVYLDHETGFFCERCGRKLSVPMNKVSRNLVQGTPLEAKMEKMEKVKNLVSDTKRAPIYLMLCTIPLLISLWFAPYSTTYLLGVVLIALAITALSIVSYWKRISPLLFFVFIALIMQGESILRNIAFTDASIRAAEGTLLIEYLALVSTIYFGAMTVLRAKIKRYIYSDLEDVREVAV